MAPPGLLSVRSLVACRGAPGQLHGVWQDQPVSVPWARAGSGFTQLFEAFALSLCKELPVAQAAQLLRVDSKALWRRIDHFVTAAREQDDMSAVRHIGIDETSIRKGHEYITVVHDLEQKRLLFATPGRDHTTVGAFAKDFQLHKGQASQVRHVCMDMSGAFPKVSAKPASGEHQLRPLSCGRAGGQGHG